MEYLDLLYHRGLINNSFVFILVIPMTLFLSLFHIVISAGFANSSMTTLACSCSCIVSGEERSLDSSVSSALQRADIVFMGKVISSRIVEDNPMGTRHEYTLTVAEQWKGTEATHIQVVTGEGGGDCGFAFQLGERYLVYATLGEAGSEYEGFVYTSRCTRTKSLRHEEIRPELGTLRGTK